MNKQMLYRKAVVYTAGVITLLVCFHITLYFGVEEKSFFERIFPFTLGGGATGAALGFIAGASFFLISGPIGWVSGAFYGAIGLGPLLLGGSLFGAFAGSLGGLGLGSIFHIVSDYEEYKFNELVIVSGLFCSIILCHFVSRKVGRLYDKYFTRPVD